MLVWSGAGEELEEEEEKSKEAEGKWREKRRRSAKEKGAGRAGNVKKEQGTQQEVNEVQMVDWYRNAEKYVKIGKKKYIPSQTDRNYFRPVEKSLFTCLFAACSVIWAVHLKHHAY